MTDIQLQAHSGASTTCRPSKEIPKCEVIVSPKITTMTNTTKIWQPANTKPSEPKVYETRIARHPLGNPVTYDEGFSNWDSKVWGYQAPTVKGAFDSESTVQDKEWRE